MPPTATAYLLTAGYPWSGKAWFSTPLPAPMIGSARIGQEEPVSPVEAKRLRPSRVAWSRVWSATGWRLFPRPCPTFPGGLSAGLPLTGLVGLVSHSPKEASACAGASASPAQREKAATMSASARVEPK